MHRISRVLALSAMVACALASPAAVLAGDHGSHPPMGPPLSVTCANKPLDAQFDCLHPGYVVAIADLHGLARTFSTCGGVLDIHGHVILHVDATTGWVVDSCGHRSPPLVLQ